MDATVVLIDLRICFAIGALGRRPRPSTSPG
jgi:hypothetical protein